MKMAAAEALYDSVPAGDGAPFSVLTVGSLDGIARQRRSSRSPACSASSRPATSTARSRASTTSRPSTPRPTARAATRASPTPRRLRPQHPDHLLVVPAHDRARACATALIALAVLWLTRKGRTPTSRWLAYAAVAAPLLPVFANSFGWIFTEVGRQPWIVFGLMTTANGVSPSVSMGEVITSMVVFTLLYGAARRRRDQALPALRPQGGRALRGAAGPRRPGRGRTPRLRLLRRAELQWISPPSGSSSSACSGRATSSSRASTSASACCCPSSAASATLRRRRRREAPSRPAQHHRPGLGRQRGVGAHRRRRDLRGLPALVRHAVQRLLPAAAAHPRRPHRAQPRLRVPPQAARGRGGRRAGTWRSSGARSCPRCSGASR